MPGTGETQRVRLCARVHDFGRNCAAGNTTARTFGPCPWPSEMLSTLMRIASAYLSRPDMGSDPGLSTKMSGVRQVESW
mgnify:CR=1 FL=1